MYTEKRLCGDNTFFQTVDNVYDVLSSSLSAIDAICGGVKEMQERHGDGSLYRRLLLVDCSLECALRFSDLVFSHRQPPLAPTANQTLSMSRPPVGISLLSSTLLPLTLSKICNVQRTFTNVLQQAVRDSGNDPWPSLDRWLCADMS